MTIIIKKNQIFMYQTKGNKIIFYGFQKNINHFKKFKIQWFIKVLIQAKKFSESNNINFSLFIMITKIY